MNELRIPGTCRDMLYLIRCMLDGKRPESVRVREMNLDALYQLANAHSLTAITAAALEQALGVDSRLEQWKQARAKAIRKNLLLDSERAVICAHLEQQGIWHMPMKGVILKEMYPGLGMREMSDNDILFDPAYRDSVRAYMESRGYRKDSGGTVYHDTYLKPPVYNFEMHTALLDRIAPARWLAYYENVRTRLIPDREGSYGCHFSHEDFYIYMTVHAFKHHHGNGTGLRTLLDYQVYLQSLGESLDWDYIRRECDTLDIREYEAQCRCVARKVFVIGEEAALTREEREFLEAVCSAGTYGTVAIGVNKSLRELQPDREEITSRTKIRYMIRRAFPDMAYMERVFPILRRQRWLLPVMWVWRLARGVVLKRKRMAREIACLLTEDQK